jgi:glycosyltransferase involved in cell wall biosynthesis
MHMNVSRVSALHAVTDSLSTVLLLGQLSYLRKAGFDPAVLCSPGVGVEKIRDREAVAVYTVAMQREISPARDIRSLFQVWRLLLRIRPVICNSGTPKAGFIVGIAAWLARVPCRIYTLRGLRLETATGIKRRILLLTERVACFCAHRVICVSSSLRERAITLGLLPVDKAVLLGAGSSNGVDTNRFAATPPKMSQAVELRQKLGIRQDQPVIGFAGRFTRDKGLPELVAAFQSVRKKVPEAILLLVGSYEEGDPVPQKIREAIECEPGVLCVEFTSQIDLYYLVMDIFVLPSHREGFPNTVLEAQAAGRPVVTTTATGAIDAVQDGVTGLLVPVGDAQRLAAALLSLLFSPTMIRSLGQAGRERVLREFSNEIIWEALTSLYREMLRRRGYAFPPDSHPEAVQCAQTQ